MSRWFRSPTLRLPVAVRLKNRQAPPWHDEWEITMDETSLVELSVELLQLPDAVLTPRLRQLQRLTENVVAHGLGIDKGRSAASEHGLPTAAMSEQAACLGTGRLWIWSSFSGGPVCPACRGVPGVLRVADPGREWFMTAVPAHSPHIRKSEKS